MKHVLAASCTALLGALLPAQTATNSIEFRHGGTISISYRALDLAQGTTLAQLMSTEEEAARFREFFNERGFLDRIRGTLELSHTTELAGTELDPGKYRLSFRIDDDLMWYLVILSEDGEEISTTILDVQTRDASRYNRLFLQPVATDNAKGKGQLEIRFGKLDATVDLAVLDAEQGTPGQNTNQDAPTVTHEVELGNGTTVGTTYRQLTIGGGQNLKSLLAEGERGDATRQFYNERYLPGFLHGAITLSVPMTIGGTALPPGEHEFMFRVDNDLSWHVVVDGKTDLTLDVATNDEIYDRLQVHPIAASENEHGGVLAIRYGPLTASLPFGMAGEATDNGPSDGGN